MGRPQGKTEKKRDKKVQQAHRNVLTVKIPDKKKISMQTMDNLEAINCF